MFIWSHVAEISTRASAEQVWRVWSNPSAWPTWDTGLETVALDGPFAVGTRGRLKPNGGPAVRFVIVASQPGQGFHDRSFLPCTQLDFIHHYEPAGVDGTPARISHRVEMRGLLTPLFSRVIGRDIARTLPDTLRALAKVAEGGQQ